MAIATEKANFKNPEELKDIVNNWLQNRSTIEHFGLWVQKVG